MIGPEYEHFKYNTHVLFWYHYCFGCGKQTYEYIVVYISIEFQFVYLLKSALIQEIVRYVW